MWFHNERNMLLDLFMCTIGLGLICLIDTTVGYRTHSAIKIEGNGYTGLSVGISNYVEEDPELIENIKVVI
ncbi:hypothetical protein FSP39_008282 [Pinctada imbricata]|uniref:Uncharacterized protein n=1 Tax=Pinctada imbricata TaxID=66713 RepID=A0AA89C1C6_PINIB|nr:hypothetical protein FSP39_008282 [Pinctada imbricata]